MESPPLDHVYIASSDHALVVARSIEVNYSVVLASALNSEVKLDLFKADAITNPTELPARMAGAILALDSESDKWVIGKEKAAIGSVDFLYRKCLIGPTLYKAGPILIFGHKARKDIAQHEAYGLDLLKLPAVRYVRLPQSRTSDLGVFLARQFECTLVQWQNLQTDTQYVARARNRLLALDLLRALRYRTRALVHTYNSLLAATNVPNLRFDHRWKELEVLSVYADAHFRYSSEGKGPKTFQQTLESYYQAQRSFPELSNEAGIDRALETFAEALSDLDGLITWWETMLSWANVASAHRQQSVHALIVDDDIRFTNKLRTALESNALAQRVAESLGRSLRFTVSDVDMKTDDLPEKVIREIRAKKLHEADASTGSPVIVFQDLILNKQSDFGLRVIRRLKSRYPWLRIVAVTAREKARLEILDAGADAYLNKTSLIKCDDIERSIDHEKLATVLRTVISPSPILSIGGASHFCGRPFKLLCERFGLASEPLEITHLQTNSILHHLPLEVGPPRLMLVTCDTELTYEELIKQLTIAREICLMFPELILIIWRPPNFNNDERVTGIAERWFEVWAKWIPNYAARVLPIDRPSAVGIRPPTGDVNDKQDAALDLLFSAEELAAVASLLRRSTSLLNLAAYNFYIPRAFSPEGATGTMAVPTTVETDVADKVANRFGGSSVSVLHGRWIGEKGVADYDTIAAIESFAPVTRANRAFAQELVEEIRARRGEETVLQIERPVSVISRDGQSEHPDLAPGLCDIHGTVNGVILYENTFRQQ